MVKDGQILVCSQIQGGGEEEQVSISEASEQVLHATRFIFVDGSKQSGLFSL